MIIDAEQNETLKQTIAHISSQSSRPPLLTFKKKKKTVDGSQDTNK